jgi:hypothetical protein
LLCSGTGRSHPLWNSASILIRKRKTYDEYVGEAALETAGWRRWNKRVHKIISILETVITYDMLYIGGGNAGLIEPLLPANVKIVSNMAGITSAGIRAKDCLADRSGRPRCNSTRANRRAFSGGDRVTRDRALGSPRLFAAFLPRGSEGGNLGSHDHGSQCCTS